MGLASCNPCSSSLLARPRNPSSGYLTSIRVLGEVWACGMLLWHVCGEEVRHLPLANKSVLGYREMQPMAGSRVYLPFGQPLADSRSWSACRPTFVQISPTPAYQTAMISMTALKLATGLQKSCASKPTYPTNPDHPSTWLQASKAFPISDTSEQATTRGHLSFRLHATRASME